MSFRPLLLAWLRALALCGHSRSRRRLGAYQAGRTRAARRELKALVEGTGYASLTEAMQKSNRVLRDSSGAPHATSLITSVPDRTCDRTSPQESA